VILFVQVDYIADDAEQETVDRFFEAYLLWLFGFVLFCSLQGDAVTRYLNPDTRRIADAPLDVVPHISWGNYVLASAYRAVLGGVEGSCGGDDPSRLSSPSSALVPRAVCDWSVSRAPLRVRAPARGPRPARPFHHGLVVVPSEGNLLPFTFDLSFHFV
jgi:hypothetical protein